MDIASTAAAGSGLASTFNFVVQHSLIMAGVIAIAMATGFDAHGLVAGVVEPVLEPIL